MSSGMLPLARGWRPIAETVRSFVVVEFDCLSLLIEAFKGSFLGLEELSVCLDFVLLSDSSFLLIEDW